MRLGVKTRVTQVVYKIESALESTTQPLGADVAAAGVVDATRLAAAVTKSR